MKKCRISILIILLCETLKFKIKTFNCCMVLEVVTDFVRSHENLLKPWNLFIKLGST